MHGALTDRVVRFWRREFNISLIKRRGYDGFIVSMHQSGTHWLKYMLSMVICETHGVPAPSHISDNSVVGHPKDPPRHPGPCIVHSHSIPSLAFRITRLTPFVEFPRYVVLVRDLRSALVSHYEKWKARYAVSFSEYLRGDPWGERFDKDIWWDIRFLNAWSTQLRRRSAAALLVHYEELQSDPGAVLRRVWSFWELPPAPDAVFDRSAAASTKDKMARLENPQAGLQVVRHERRNPGDWFDAGDREFFQRTIRRYLKRDYGYDYSSWELPA